MSIRRSVAALGPITRAYRSRVLSGSIALDKEQLSLGAALDSVHAVLTSEGSDRCLIPDHHLPGAARYYAGSSAWSGGELSSAAVAAAHAAWNPSPKGVYVHGSVGVGKSMLMDLFYSVCDAGLPGGGGAREARDDGHAPCGPIRRSRRRCHFHEFMLDVHERIHAYKKRHPRADPIPPVAAALARESRLLCFDEMQITDIADAMIVSRLLTILLDLGVVIVTTSNRPPCGLYEGGINRYLFLPFIDTLRDRMTVIEMKGVHDYRRDATTSGLESTEGSLPAYLCTHTDPNARDILNQWFSKGTGEPRARTIPVAMGRSLRAERANASCGWFGFEELCDRPLGAADYIALADNFEVIIVENVPQLSGRIYNEARRFVTLVDALYEAKTKLVLASDVPREELFVGFDAAVETSDGDEEIAVDENPSRETSVIGEGGSSSSFSTTVVRTRDGEAEWSATGRVGVSLAQLSAVREVSFSFQRAESRLAEMASKKWGRKDKTRSQN
ncbi:hypothetical protein ACHAWF_017546 [Thalassiosira exigua]